MSEPTLGELPALLLPQLLVVQLEELLLPSEQLNRAHVLDRLDGTL